MFLQYGKTVVMPFVTVAVYVILLINAHLAILVDSTEWNILDPLALRSPREWKVPDAPENFRAKSSSSNEITLWWEPPANAHEILVRGYTLSYGIESSTQKIVIEGVNSNSFTVTGLAPNTTYAFSLTAYNEAPDEDSERVLLTATTLSNSGVNSNNFRLMAPTSLKWNPTKILGDIFVSWIDPNSDSMSNRLQYTTTASYSQWSTDETYNKKFYIIEYGIKDKRVDDSVTPKRVTTNTNSVLLTQLSSGREYEVHIRVIKGKTESVWSNTIVVLPPLNVDDDDDDNENEGLHETDISTTTKFGLQRRTEYCDFESPTICDFINDVDATLQWRRQAIEKNQFPGRHSMVLEYFPEIKLPTTSKSSVFAFGRLLSPVYDLHKSDDICISFRYEIRPFSFGGVLKVSLLFETDDWSESILLMRKSLTTGNKKPSVDHRRHHHNYHNYYFESNWQNISLEAKNRPRQGFQVIFEAIKNERNADFRIIIDDFKVTARKCANGERQIGVIDGFFLNFQLLFERLVYAFHKKRLRNLICRIRRFLG